MIIFIWLTIAVILMVVWFVMGTEIVVDEALNPRHAIAALAIGAVACLVWPITIVGLIIYGIIHLIRVWKRNEW